MSQLLDVVSGWLGYLERPAVVLQLLLVALALCLYVLSPERKRLPFLQGRTLPLLQGRRGQLLLLAGLGAMTLGLALLGQPFGLLLVLALLIGGWFALGLLRRGLARVLQPSQLVQLDVGLLRPLYLVIVLFTLIRQVDNPLSLALIPIGSWFGTEVTLGRLLLGLIVVYVLAVGSGPPAAALALLAHRLLGNSDSSRRAMALVIRYAAVGMGILWTLDQIGFNRTAILAVAGGLSVGLGFGIKEVFSNFISGLWLLFEGSVRPGDILFIDGDPCEVRSLGLRAAVLWRNRDNAELVIPNQNFFTDTTTTYTGTDGLRRSEVQVGAAYRHDPVKVIALLEETARANPRVLSFPEPIVLLLNYGDSSINYSLRFWIANPMDNISICSQVQTAVWRTFRDQGIEIPFPQRVVSRPSRDP